MCQNWPMIVNQFLSPSYVHAWLTFVSPKPSGNALARDQINYSSRNNAFEKSPDGDNILLLFFRFLATCTRVIEIFIYVTTVNPRNKQGLVTSRGNMKFLLK